MRSNQLLLTLVLIILMFLLSLTSPFFLKWDNFRNILDQSTINIIVGVGMTLVICSGGIDLSVGAVAALTGAVMAVLMKAGVPVPAAVFCGLAAGASIGAANGSLIAFLNINPFIVTLASMSVVRGLTLIITGGIPVSGFPLAFTWLGSGRFSVLPVPVVLTVVLVALGAVCLNLTRLGCYIMALGGNEEALRRAGVAVNRCKITVYAMGALTSALAGLVLAARLNSADPTAGMMLELDAIATAILGGTSIQGGRGSVGGTVIAGLLLAVLRNGLTINAIPSYYQQLVMGLIILAAVVFSELKSRQEDARMR